MISRIRGATAGYSRPFWLLFWGTLVSRSGSSMVWPFLTIYLRQHGSPESKPVHAPHRETGSD